MAHVTELDGPHTSLTGDALNYLRVTEVAHSRSVGELLYRAAGSYPLADKGTHRAEFAVAKVDTDVYWLAFARRLIYLESHGLGADGSEHWLGVAGGTEPSEPDDLSGVVVLQQVFVVIDSDWLLFDPSVWSPV